MLEGGDTSGRKRSRACSDEHEPVLDVRLHDSSKQAEMSFSDVAEKRRTGRAAKNLNEIYTHIRLSREKSTSAAI